MSASISSEPERTYIVVPYEARDQVKSLGGCWDRDAKSWYIPRGLNPGPFGQWQRKAAPVERDPRAQFADELRKAGFQIDGQHPIMDGKIHRLPVEGDKGTKRNGSYCAFGEGIPTGWHQNFKTDDKPVRWKATRMGLTEQERVSLAAAAATSKRIAEQKRDQEADRASQRAIEILATAKPTIGGHAYLTTKQVSGQGLSIAAIGTSIETESGREIDISGRLLVPICDINGTIMSLQIIDDQGNKMFLRGGKVGGGQHIIGDINSPWPLHIAEGYATAATIHEATGHPVVVAFNAHNLSAVAAQQRAARPDRTLFIVGDNDHQAKRNIGTEAALTAAAAVDGYVLIPAFTAGERGTDWNDAMRDRGLAAVRQELSVGIATGARRQIAKDIAQQRGYGNPTERARGREICR